MWTDVKWHMVANICCVSQWALILWRDFREELLRGKKNRFDFRDEISLFVWRRESTDSSLKGRVKGFGYWMILLHVGNQGKESLIDPQRAAMTHFVVQIMLLGQTGLLFMGAVRWQVQSVCTSAWVGERKVPHESFTSSSWIQEHTMHPRLYLSSGMQLIEFKTYYLFR